jgi:DHA1 family bicyclomycin/chloramphenicol resistance-like MFS transporter
MRAGQLAQLSGAVGLLVFTLVYPALGPLLVCVFIIIASVGVIMPMATALAMNEHPERAGSASGLLGFTQFTLGSIVAPLVGVAGPGSALPMALVMVVAVSLSLIATQWAQTLSGTGADIAPAPR